MKNLRNIPSNIYFSNLLSDIENKDCTSVFKLNNKNYLDITIPVSELLQNNNKAITNRHIPIQDDNTYNAFYQYYNYTDNDIKAIPDIKNEYPVTS